MLLSLLLSLPARADQKSLVFSGVFAMVWIGEAVVTLQIKLLGGNMSVMLALRLWRFRSSPLTSRQLLLPVRVHHRIHTLSPRHRGHAQRITPTGHRPNTRLYCSGCMVPSCRRQHSWWIRRCTEPSRYRCLPFVRLLCWFGVSMFH